MRQSVGCRGPLACRVREGAREKGRHVWQTLLQALCAARGHPELRTLQAAANIHACTHQGRRLLVSRTRRGLSRANRMCQQQHEHSPCRRHTTGQGDRAMGDLLPTCPCAACRAALHVLCHTAI
jgi:hypothetical protein